MSGRVARPLPGGYRVGEKVFFTGPSETFPSGNKLVQGQQGEVMGPAALVNVKGNGVSVLFPGNKGNIKCYLNQARRLRDASQPTPRLRPTHATQPVAPARRGLRAGRFGDRTLPTYSLTAGGCVHRWAGIRRRRCPAATSWARRCSTRGRTIPFRAATSSCTASRARWSGSPLVSALRAHAWRCVSQATRPRSTATSPRCAAARRPRCQPHARAPRTRRCMHTPSLNPAPTASHCGGGRAGEGLRRTSPLCL